VVLVLLGMAACTTRTVPMNQSELIDFATRYAAAWSGQNPEDLASFYAESGSLTVNAGLPSVGRAVIAATAKEYMTAFPDMVVEMDSVSREGSRAIFHWTWTGTNTGPGGTGRPVRISGYEEWTIGGDGLIVESRGHFDEAEYQRQLGGDGGGR
jgi:predicted ester cyclase